MAEIEAIKCPSCGEISEPIVNIADPEQPSDYPYAECPNCHFHTGKRKDESDAYQFYKHLSIICTPLVV